MTKTFKLKIVTPSKMVIDEEVQKVFVTTVNGIVEFLPNHASIIMSSVPSITSYYDSEGNKKELFTSTGVINLSDNTIMFCTEVAEFAEDINLERAQASKERAENRIKEASKFDVNRAKASLNRAKIRIELKKHSV